MNAETERGAASSGDGEGRRWRALVLAASRGPDDPMARHAGVLHKATIKVGGVPMLRRVVQALLDSRRVGEVVVMIDDAAAAQAALGAALAARVRLLPSGTSAAGSVLKAVERDGVFLPLLVTTGDLPFLTPQAVDAFIAAAEQRPASLVVALARRDDVLVAFPDMRRTWMRLGGEAVTSCNLFALKDAEALKAVAFWQRAERHRKRPWRIAMAFGPLSLLRLVFSRGGACHVVRLAGKRLGTTADAVFIDDARLAIDVDKPSDLELARQVATRNGQA